jgi:metallophosphoesterase superfamily enzyme
MAAGSAGGPEKRSCWLRVEYRARDRPVLPGEIRCGAGELLVLPAFNPLGGIESLNRSVPARGRSFLFRRFMAGTRPRAYLLDGTDLGPILSSPPARAARRRSSKAR